MDDETKNGSLAGRAVVYRGNGGHQVIQIAAVSIRPPERGEVRIAVEAAAVNPADLMMRRSSPGGATGDIIPGMDAAGVIESAGPGVTRLKAGDRVMAAVMPGRPDGGAQSSFIVVPEASVVTVPRGLSLVEASAVPMNGLTALLALETAALSHGQYLGVTGGAGFLASYLIPAARKRGLKIIADAKPADAALVESYGADIVVERGPDFASAIRRHIPEGVPALLDAAVIGESVFGAIADGGVYIPVRGWDGRPAGRGIGVTPIFVYKVLGRTDWLEYVRDMAVDGEIRPRITHEYPVEEIAEAQKALEAGGLRGRPVVRFR